LHHPAEIGSDKGLLGIARSPVIIATGTLASELATLRQIEQFCVVRTLAHKCPAFGTFDHHGGNVSTFGRVTRGQRAVRFLLNGYRQLAVVEVS
jgi:hypothetical protein